MIEASEEKRKGWATPHGFIDFEEPVTYGEALEQMEKLIKLVGGKNE